MSCYCLMSYCFSSSCCLSIPSKWDVWRSCNDSWRALLCELMAFVSEYYFAHGTGSPSLVSSVLPPRENNCSLNAPQACCLFVWLMDSWVSGYLLLQAYLFKESARPWFPYIRSTDAPVCLVLLGGTRLLDWYSWTVLAASYGLFCLSGLPSDSIPRSA